MTWTLCPECGAVFTPDCPTCFEPVPEAEPDALTALRLLTAEVKARIDPPST